MQNNADMGAESGDDAAREFPVPVVGANLPVEIVGRRVRRPVDMFDWERSESRAEVLVFVQHMNAVVKRYPSAPARRRRQPNYNANVEKVLVVLRTVGEWAKERRESCQDHQTAVKRFGDFHGQLRADGQALLDRTYHGGGRADYRNVMLPVYLERSFGDPATMAYGTAHELSFCVFLVSLFKLHRLTWTDEPYVVTVIFDRYLDIVDYVIQSYQLDPSPGGDEHGNWCLSGYQYVGFLWGSAQLAGNCRDSADASAESVLLSPAAVIGDADVCGRHRDESVFAKCVDATYRRAKVGVPLWYHSYQLWSLSALPRWDRVNGCLMAAYQRDVLGRFEVVRQLAFCELFKFAQNLRPPGTSFYDIVPAAPPSEASAVPSAMKVSNDDDDDDGRGMIEYGETEDKVTEDGGMEDGEMEDGLMEDGGTVENEGSLLYCMAEDCE